MDNSRSQFCFCELAPLYGVGALSDTEREWVEAQVRECPELEAELADYQDMAAMLTYSAPQAPLSSGVKDRLFQTISGAPSPKLEQETSPPTTVGLLKQADRLRWRPYMAPGIQIAILHIDKKRREMSCLVRAEAQAEYPAHRHGGIEEIMMIEGKLEMCDRTLQVGDYVRSEAGSIHPLASTPKGCTFFLRTALESEALVN